MKIVTLEQGSDEWKIWRMKGIGASDAPAIEGISPYQTQRGLFYDKKGIVLGETEDNEFIFAQGHKVEELIRKQFKDVTGVDMKPVCATHAKLDFIRASLDGFDPKLGVLEAKLVGQDALSKARDGEIPAHHFSQIQHQLFVADCDVGQWFGHDGKRDGVLVPVKRDKEYLKRLIEKEQAFWAMVQANTPPPLTENDYLVPDDQTLLMALREAKEQAANAETYYEELRKRVVETYKHPKIAGAGVKVFKVTRNGSISYKDIPEIQKLSQAYLDAFRGKPSTSWTCTIDKPKKKASI